MTSRNAESKETQEDSDMKTVIPNANQMYGFATELGMQEQPVLDWLRAHRYPNLRRADMIHADFDSSRPTCLRAPRAAVVPYVRPI